MSLWMARGSLLLSVPGLAIDMLLTGPEAAMSGFFGFLLLTNIAEAFRLGWSYRLVLFGVGAGWFVFCILVLPL